MGLLDDLKSEADALRQKQQVSQEALNQNLVIAHTKLNETLRYWIELFNSLNVIKPIIPRFYFIDATNRMENLRQCDYNVNGRRLTVDHKDYIDAVILRFRCASDQKLTIEKQTDPLVQRLRDALWAHNLRFDLKEVRNERGYTERGTFTVMCEVPVKIVIDGDLEKGQIRISGKNLEKLGEFSYAYDFDEWGKPMLEELAKIIVGKPNTFRTLGRHQQAMMTTTTRAKLEPRPDEATQPTAPQLASPLDDPDESPRSSFFGNIKSMLKR
jgi:hypothetical protein